MFKWLEGWFTPSEKKVKVPEEAMGLKPTVRVISKAQLAKRTKIQLEELGRENGIELDRRLKKDKLVSQVHKKLKETANG